MPGLDTRLGRRQQLDTVLTQCAKAVGELAYRAVQAGERRLYTGIMVDLLATRAAFCPLCHPDEKRSLDEMTAEELREDYFYVLLDWADLSLAELANAMEIWQKQAKPQRLRYLKRNLELLFYATGGRKSSDAKWRDDVRDILVAHLGKRLLHPDNFMEMLKVALYPERIRPGDLDKL